MIYRILMLVAVVAVLTSCDSSQPAKPTTDLVVPEIYDSALWSINTIEEYQIRANLDALLGLLKSARKVDVTLTSSQLMQAYQPLMQYTIPSEVDFIGQFLENAAIASGKLHTGSAEPTDGTVGGVYGGYLFDRYGRDVDEFVQKSLFATMLYYQATLRSSGVVLPRTVDQIVALFGANPTFPNGSAKAAQKDVFSANYAARRDKNDGNGFYSRFKKAALTARAAAEKPEVYGNELKNALKEMLLIWEKSQMATAINYSYLTITTLSATQVDDVARGKAMHTFAEAAGIIRGWKSVPPSSRMITDATLDELTQLLLISDANNPTCYKFWLEPALYLNRLEQVTKKLQTVYGFSDAEMEDFKTNWVSAQSR